MTTKNAGTLTEENDESALELVRAAPGIPELAHRLGLIVRDLGLAANDLRLSLQTIGEPDPAALASFALAAGAVAGWLVLLSAALAATPGLAAKSGDGGSAANRPRASTPARARARKGVPFKAGAAAAGRLATRRSS